MKLHYQKFGEGQPLIILHGLFGSADNWLTFGKKVADSYTVYLVDQRNHGRSPHSADFSYELMAADLLELLDAEGIDKASILGHSMGGKTAMTFARLHPERVSRLVVVDIGVKSYKPHHDAILAGLKAIDVDKIQSRSEAEDAMKVHIDDFGVRQFLLKSLYRKDKDKFGWRINIPVLDAKMPEILKAMEIEVVDVPTLFIAGSRSDYIKEADKEKISGIFRRAEFAELPTGHWVHAEDPEGLEEILRNFVTAQ